MFWGNLRIGKTCFNCPRKERGGSGWWEHAYKPVKATVHNCFFMLRCASGCGNYYQFLKIGLLIWSLLFNSAQPHFACHSFCNERVTENWNFAWISLITTLSWYPIGKNCAIPSGTQNVIKKRPLCRMQSLYFTVKIQNLIQHITMC